MTDADKTAGKQRGRPFPKGRSGNPEGRPEGSRNKATLALEALIDGNGAAVVNALVGAALRGDVSAGRALLDRLVPPRKDRPVAFAMPGIKTPGDAAKAFGAIVAAVAAGEMTPMEATEVSRLLADFVKVLELTEIESRIQALEDKR